MLLQPGARLEGYEVVEEIGQGGMGVVYRGRDLDLDRPVALKVLDPSRAGDGEALARFEQEARATSALNHPHIVQVLDFGTDTVEGQELHFIAMELVEGSSLRKLFAGPAPITEILAVVAQVADALDTAHEHGVVHRDVKPDNVVVTADGYAKVLDFGIAKLTEAERSRPHVDGELSVEGQVETQAGDVKGTLVYMAPEQIQGGPLDRRTDVFALGNILFEAAMGDAPFRGATASATLRAIVGAPAPAIRRPPRGVPLAYDRVVQRCLEKDPDRRYPSCREVASELRALRDRLTGSPLVRTQAWARSHPVRAGLYAAAAVVLAALVAALLW